MTAQVQTTTTTTKKNMRNGKPSAKRARTSGLVPRYAGFNPRNFQTGEWKFVDVQTLGVAYWATPTAAVCLNGMIMGTDVNHRVGRQVGIRSIEIHMEGLSIATTTASTIRNLLVWDRQANGTLPVIADVLVATGVNPVTVAPRQLNNRKRFKIILDHVFDFGAIGGSSLAAQHKKYYFKFKNPILTTFNSGNTGTYTDIATYALWWFGFGSSATAAAAGTVSMNSRIRYTDQ